MSQHLELVLQYLYKLVALPFPFNIKMKSRYSPAEIKLEAEHRMPRHRVDNSGL